MIFEVHAHGAQVATDCPIYNVKPGGLYIVTVPDDVSDEAVNAMVAAVFADDKRVLDPPATFLFSRPGMCFEEAPDNYLQDMVSRLQNILEDRRAEGAESDEQRGAVDNG